MFAFDPEELIIQVIEVCNYSMFRERKTIQLIQLWLNCQFILDCWLARTTDCSEKQHEKNSIDSVVVKFSIYFQAVG